MNTLTRFSVLAGLLASAPTVLPQAFIPGGVDSAGSSSVVPDVAVWYSKNQLPGHRYPGYVTNGPVDLAAQSHLVCCGPILIANAV